MQNEITKIIGFNPNNLPENDFNKRYAVKMKYRALFKIMLHVHTTLNFEKHFDPDLNNYIKKYSSHTKQEEDYLHIDYDPSVYTETRIANCGIYSNYFEFLTEDLGFEVRHVGLKAEDGWCGHWCSEVKVNNKWLFFDCMYLICSGYSAKEIMDDPINRYFDLIPSLLKGISKKSIIDLWQGLEINKETTYELGKDIFFNKYYGDQDEI